jgi:HTH-type transcriptional regulator/antitoxin HigA
MLEPIRNEEQYEAALAYIYGLMQQNIEEGSSLSDELEIMSICVKEYEQEHYPISSSS